MHYRRNPTEAGGQECTLHILYIDSEGRTHKMTVGMSQSQEVVLAQADKIRHHFTELLKAFDCTVLSMQLELLKPLTEPLVRQGKQSKAQVLPFPHMGPASLGLTAGAVHLVDDGFIDLVGRMLT